MPNDTTTCDQPAHHPHTCDCTPAPPVPDPTLFRLLRGGTPTSGVRTETGTAGHELDAQWQQMYERISDQMGEEFATALDFNVGARMANATRSLILGMEAAEAIIGVTLEGER